MSVIDWLVFGSTLVGILVYGYWKGRRLEGADDYLRAGQNMPWYMVLLGVMATQASAITFLSAPGQAFTDGMRFVQYYFGLPFAMIVISVTFIPLFRRLNVYTAYEFLEQRFDRRARVVASALFLISRGLSTGVSIYAPSIIVASLFGWNIYLTNILVGGLLLIYTMRGGARSVAYTQTVMFGIILISIAIAGWYLVQTLPYGMTFSQAVALADAAGRMNVITTTFDLHDKYNLWSGLIGGFFLALSYFGTDQSQVGRFITARDDRESRRGLLLNGIVKIPMQFGILLIGALLVAYYSTADMPLTFNPLIAQNVKTLAPAQERELSQRWDQQRREVATAAQEALRDDLSESARQRYKAAVDSAVSVRSEFRSLVRSLGIAESNDTNYVFLSFVRSLPAGLVGLIFAIVIMASWGSISAGFHSLATASMMDIHHLVQSRSEKPFDPVRRAKLHTLGWGVFGVAVSMLATRMGSLIEAVNILGSLFYGPILGIFLVAFYVKRANGTDVFWGAIIAEIVVVAFWLFNVVSFLWLNVVGALVAVAVAWSRSSLQGAKQA
jgi:Na+/proline symporter